MTRKNGLEGVGAIPLIGASHEDIGELASASGAHVTQEPGEVVGRHGLASDAARRVGVSFVDLDRGGCVVSVDFSAVDHAIVIEVASGVAEFAIVEWIETSFAI